ncbi:tyrosine-protein phosphatase [Metabacillus litoralis]|uniref:tyrosine-protein phosphatase n=1 Tax=Metabacillus litoralis TaxID=152268 RepID=UPI000EF5D040|nr:tyrosine-protein phosphatase [Metabacillus litoralis]
MSNKLLIQHFEKIYNFRDIGGIKTEQGSTLKQGVLYRSDKLSSMTPSDLEKLKKFKIKTILDLRSEKEYNKNKPILLSAEEINSVNIPLLPIETQDANFRKFLSFLFRKTGADDFKNFTREYYHSIAFYQTPQIKKILTLISDDKNWPVLINCSAGKDRTGIIASIIQSLVQVPYQKVLEEYLLTNDYYKHRLDIFIKVMRWMTLFHVSPERTEFILKAHPEVLEQLYTNIKERFGTIEAYLMEACQLEVEILDRLKQNLVLKSTE